jgi:AcrR family transcriptional regulator
VVKQERAERTREAIVLAAARVFEAEGFAAAPLADITRSARVTKGALYFHFASKRELALALVAEARAALDSLVADVVDRRGGEMPIQLLIDLTHAVLHRVAEDPVLRAGLRLGADRDLYPEPASGLQVDWGALVEQLLAPDGRPVEQLQSPTRVVPLGSVLCGLELVFRRHPGRPRPEVLTAVWQLLLPGLTRMGEAARYQPAGTERPGGPDA